MEVQIISRDMIKPSASTPLHLRTYKMSLLDQVAPQLYTAIVLFYSPSPSFDNPSEKSDRWKKSLSNTLTQFYPLAGRLKDDSTIDCNDDGAAYIEARIANDMSMAIQQPVNIHQLQQLLPCNPYEKLPVLSTEALLAIQVNQFGCGGVAMGVCVWHGIADGSTVGNFVKSWAEIARAADENIDGVVVDWTSLFPPQEFPGFSLPDLASEAQIGNMVTKRLVFDGSKIAALRGKIGDIGPYLDRPTRVEAVSTLIWGAMMTATAGENESLKKAMVVVNLRNRMNPPLPQRSIGNIVLVAMADWPNDETTSDYNFLAGKIHDSIKLMSNEDHIRKVHADIEFYVRFASKDFQEAAKSPMFKFSSWCRFPFYEADFGWGKPIWVANGLGLYNFCIFLDSGDGEGIEAWVGLSKEDMLKFEQHPDILTYASFKSKPF